MIKNKNYREIVFLYILLIFLVLGFYSCGQKSIEKNDVIKIALANNLGEGIDSLKVKLLWNENYQKKVWIVLSTLAESQTANGYSAAGKGLIIDSENGNILKENYWYLK